jgi:hypothetical protein
LTNDVTILSLQEFVEDSSSKIELLNKSKAAKKHAADKTDAGQAAEMKQMTSA